MNEDGKIDYAEVMRRLPHRYPFLLVDKAEDFVPRTSIVGIKNVSLNEPFFPGHFPIDPVMPGVLIVEAMAQAAGAPGGETRLASIATTMHCAPNFSAARATRSGSFTAAVLIATLSAPASSSGPQAWVMPPLEVPRLADVAEQFA